MLRDASALAALRATLSRIAATLPPAFAVGPGAESRIPLAVAVLGGMIFSTLLTLFVVPCAYSLMAPFERQKYGDHGTHALPHPYAHAAD